MEETSAPSEQTEHPTHVCFKGGNASVMLFNKINKKLKKDSKPCTILTPLSYMNLYGYDMYKLKTICLFAAYVLH